MLLFGRIVDGTALAAVIASTLAYCVAATRTGESRFAWARAARGLFLLSTAAVIAAVVTLGTMLVTHQFESEYVYEHSARAMDPLYYFPSLWAGQEGSFLLWAFWTAILGVVLSLTAHRAEPRVMPIYNGILIFLTAMLVIRSPFLPLDTHGMPVPSEGLGLNPNLENPWMVIHPPTLFLGLSALGAPFAYAMMGLLWRDRDGWLRRALPWGLFGFSVLGLAMMMGGYWAYEMLGWGGFWGWDPVENGPLIPWLFLIAFLHSAQVQRVRNGLVGTTLTFAMLPFVTGLYETFLTRTGILEKFSVHSFSTLGGVGNDVLLYVLLGSILISIMALLWRRREIGSTVNVWETPATREFGYLMAIILVTLCALISTIGMSAPLLTSIAQRLHIASYTGSVPEDFYNHANYPIAVLLAIGMGIAPFLSWGRAEADTGRLMNSYGIAVVAVIVLTVLRAYTGSAVYGWQLVGQLILFAASIFALVSNGYLLARRMRREAAPARPDLPPLPKREGKEYGLDATTRLGTAGGVVSHIGVAVLLLGIVCLVTFVRRDPDVLAEQGRPIAVLGGEYTMTFLGQTGDYRTDRNNALRFRVVSRRGNEQFVALLPFAQRATEGGRKMIFAHPAIAHHLSGDLYVALKDGPDEIYRTPISKFNVPLGGGTTVGPYSIRLDRFDRDPKAAAFVQATGQMPDVFPVTAVLDVTFHGVTTAVRPKLVMHADNPDVPDTPEVPLPAGWLVSFQSMNAGSADPNNPTAGAMNEGASFSMRADSGPPVDAFILDVTTRPMINLVWIGTMLLVLGGLMSMSRRIRENRLAIDLEYSDTPRATPVAPGGRAESQPAVAADPHSAEDSEEKPAPPRRRETTGAASHIAAN
ncbi:MAG: cytochrome c biogenesis protein CcsA [Capsulimonadaceae bacterium]